MSPSRDPFGAKLVRDDGVEDERGARQRALRVAPDLLLPLFGGSHDARQPRRCRCGHSASGAASADPAGVPGSARFCWRASGCSGPRRVVICGNVQQSARRPGADARDWVVAHPAAAPAPFLTLYVSCAILRLPVWWLQILSGYAWGARGRDRVEPDRAHLWVGRRDVRRPLAWRRVVPRPGQPQDGPLPADRRGARAQRAAGGPRGEGFVRRAVRPEQLPLRPDPHPRPRRRALGTLLGGLPVVAGWVAISAQAGRAGGSARFGR